MLDEVALIRVRDLKAGEHGEIYADLERDMHGPATILVIVNETPGIPCCNKCTRQFYSWAASRQAGADG